MIKGFFSFLVDYKMELLELTMEHVQLTLMSLSIALFIGLPIGILLTRHKRFADPVMGAVGVVQTIPSVALLGLLLPLLGIGVVPAIVALFLYALLPIVRNTYTGIEGVESYVKEAAKGMGMSDWQILKRVELPLAVPVIFAGIRTATVINVGVATLCALIAAGGLGEFIFRGIQLNNTNMVLAGAIPAAVLALVFDFVLGVLQTFIRKIIKPVLLAFAILLLVVIPIFVMPSLFSRPFLAGFAHEFVERDDGYRGLQEIYGLELKIKELETGLMFNALNNKDVDLTSGHSTDGRVKAYNLKILTDDKNVFPPYYAAPFVRRDTLRRYPVLREVFSRIAGKLTNEKMAELNYRAEHLHERPKNIAIDFLKDVGLKTDIERKKQGKADIIISSKDFTEQYILSEIFTNLIENYSELDVDIKSGLTGTKLCFDALKGGDIDIYPEYTGTALFVILKSPKEIVNLVINDPNKLYKYVKEEALKRYNLELLEPLGFNNTWALLMRGEHAEQLGIETISDLARHLNES